MHHLNDVKLSLVLGLVCLVLLTLWIPHYLTWPYWADHDVFANVARAWDRGVLPYRDVRLNNFPGTVYLFYVLGKLGGWGRPWAFYACDAALVVSLTILLPIWSRRTLGWFLPGLVGSLSFLRSYLSLDYCMTAQRDWQGPVCSVLGLLIVQAWPGRTGRIVSAFLAACAFSIRPQTVLLWPALVLAVMASGEPVDLRSRLRRGLAWLAFLVVFSAVVFLPLMVNGIFGEFLRSLRLVAYGSKYNQVGWESVGLLWLFQPRLSQWLLFAIAIGWLIRSSDSPHRSLAMSWLLAMAGVSLYKPLSPIPHPYLGIPLVLVGSVVLALLAGLIVLSREISPRLRALGVAGLLVLGSSSTLPDRCQVWPSLRAFSVLRSGVEPEVAPPGYRAGTVRSAAFYPWSDYRATLLYLRNRTRPTTRVANVLKGVPAIASEIDRPSAFPAESITWLLMVNRDDEASFVESLEKSPDSVVVWAPGEVGPVPGFRVDRLEATIRRLYEFETRFGVIEVWRRRGDLN
jgi:hypothetical protein